MEAALNGPNGRTALGPATLTIGRTPDNQLVVNDPKTSSHHAEIRPDGQGYSITDLGSTNGTFVNGQRLTPHVPRQLNTGDAIRIGDTQYNYEGGSGSSGSQYASTVYAGPGQSGGYDPTVAASPPPPQSTAYGANAMQGYQSSSPNYPSAQPPYQAPGVQQYNAGAQPSYPGVQPSYPPPPSPNPAYSPPPQSYTPPPAVPPGYQVPPPVYNPAQSGYPPPMSQTPGAGLPSYGALPPQAPQQPKRRSTGMIVLIVAIVLILILGSVGFLVVHNNQVKVDNDHATATAVQGSHLTATAQVFATQTAIVNAQATATASVIAANPNPYPPHTGTLALIDPLKDNTAGNKWGEGAVGSSGNCGFSGGSYHVSDTAKNVFVYCIAENSNFSNFAYQVTMVIDKGDCGGLVFRADANTNSFYHFVVCQNGAFWLSSYSNSNGTVLIQPKDSAAVQTGLNQQNVIGVVIQGSSINLYINNQNVASATDSTLTSGTIGVIAESVNNASDAAYTNAKVWTL
jgi:FHA domain